MRLTLTYSLPWWLHMKWNSLKEMKCPKCNGSIIGGILDLVFTCGTPRCTFKISKSKFDEVISERHVGYAIPSTIDRSYDENLSDLNNL